MKTDDLEILLIQEYKLKQSEYDKKRYLKIKEELKQKYIENRDDYREKQKNYYNNNKKRYKDYYIKNADRIKAYNRNYKLQKREANKDKINELQQNYYEVNKIKIIEKALEKVNCDCGCMISKINLLRHKKSPKHIKIMEMKN